MHRNKEKECNSKNIKDAMKHTVESKWNDWFFHIPKVSFEQSSDVVFLHFSSQIKRTYQ
jgi:hypothetical protein